MKLADYRLVNYVLCRSGDPIGLREYGTKQVPEEWGHSSSPHPGSVSIYHLVFTKYLLE
jgi:hypothetical protein